MNVVKNTFVTIFSGGIVTSMLGLGAVYWNQAALMYPASFPEGSRTQIDTPDKYHLPYENVILPTPDGEKIHAYIMIQTEQPNMRPTILYCHANAGNMGHRLPIAQIMYSEGYNLVLFSYRGYGKSTGTSNEKGLNIDAQTILDYILQHPALSHTRIIVYGPSLGGAVGINLASKNLDKISALILENTFTSMPEMAGNVIPYAKYISPIISGLCRDIWPSEAVIKTIKDMPILFLAGGKDEVVKPPMMKRLYVACHAPKSFKLFENGDHNTTVTMPGYFEAIFEFLRKNNLASKN